MLFRPCEEKRHISLDANTPERIVSAIESNSVTLFMKGSREAPRCGFSAALVGILGSLIPDHPKFARPRNAPARASRARPS